MSGLPQRIRLELKFRGVAAARRSPFSLAQKKRIETAVKRRAEQMNLVISEIRLERGRLLVVAVMPPHLRLANVERGLQGALTGIMQREFPHMLRGPAPRGGDMEGIPF